MKANPRPLGPAHVSVNPARRTVIIALVLFTRFTVIIVYGLCNKTGEIIQNAYEYNNYLSIIHPRVIPESRDVTCIRIFFFFPFGKFAREDNFFSGKSVRGQFSTQRNAESSKKKSNKYNS